MIRLPKKFKYLQILALVVASIIYFGIKNLPAINSTPVNTVSAKEEECYVERVVDGDTLKLSDGQRVRLIGIDTPELHYSDKLVRDSKKTGKDIKTIQAMGAKASDFTKSLCLNKKIKIEFDVKKNDRYGRLLGYVYLEDGTFVNAKIVEEGYGQIMTVPPNVKYSDLFLKLEKQARQDKKGLWKSY